MESQSLQQNRRQNCSSKFKIGDLVEIKKVFARTDPSRREEEKRYLNKFAIVLGFRQELIDEDGCYYYCLIYIQETQETMEWTSDWLEKV